MYFLDFISAPITLLFKVFKSYITIKGMSAVYQAQAIYLLEGDCVMQFIPFFVKGLYIGYCTLSNQNEEVS